MEGELDNDEAKERAGGAAAKREIAITGDVKCRKCKYNLRGLQDGGNCPECGTAISETLDRIALPITRDVLCVECKHNLRGLRDGLNCPECGTPVSESLDLVEATELCMSCMTPNHPSATVCRHCGNWMKGAGATANSFRVAPGAATTATRRRFTSVVLIWIMVGPTALASGVYTFGCIASLFSVENSASAADFVLALVMLAATIVFSAILFYVTLAYIRRPEEKKEEEEDEDGDGEPEEDV